MQLRLLGPVELRDGDRDLLAECQPSQRALLALRANQVVSRAHLIDRLWGERLPGTANNLIQGYVSRLRAALRRAGGADTAARIVTRAQGYLVRLEPWELDLLEFERLAADGERGFAAGDIAAAVEAMREALALWRGPALAGLPMSTTGQAEAARLEENRLVVLERRIEADLVRGRHWEVIGELRALVADYPLRERLWAQLMAALCHGERPAEALAVYGEARGRLVGELGVEPSRQLQHLHQAILAGIPPRDLPFPTMSPDRNRSTAWDNAVNADRPPGQEDEPRPANRGESGIPGQYPQPITGAAFWPAELIAAAVGRASSGARTSPAPRQLPLDVPGFTGREAELAQLDGLLTEAREQPATVVIASVSGTAGVGKTALAVHWAHRVQPLFPDGTLFADLRGYDPTGVPVQPDEVLDGFLRVLGVSPEMIPPSAEERSARFRSRLDGQRVLIVLDNAATSEQVRLLLPASAGCLAMVTSRSQLSGLIMRDGARRVPVDSLAEAEALALLRRVIRPARVDAEPDEAADLARLCGYLPLALCLAAERANTRPHLMLADLTQQLADEYDRLDLLATDDDETTAVRAAFSWSYKALAPAAARMFRLLGLHPGPEISLAAVAVLGATTRHQARRQLDSLTSVHLLKEISPYRYRFHDLLRVYALERAHADEPAPEREAAVRRVLDWYVHTADAADRVLMPRRRHIPLEHPDPASQPLKLTSPGAALGWCETERANLVAATLQAAENGLSDIAWKLPFALWSYFTVRKRWTDWITTHRRGLAAVRESHDTYGEARLLTSIANAYRDVRDFDAAFAHFEQAISLSRQIGDRWVEAAALTLLAIAHRDLRHFDKAIDCTELSLEIFDAIDDPWGKAWALCILGETYGDLQRHDTAIDYSQQALALFKRIDDPWGGGWTLFNLAQIYRHLHRFDEAFDYAHQALAAAHGIGNRQGEALALYTLGKIQDDAGQLSPARESWQQALAIFDALGAPQAAQVRSRLETANAPQTPGNEATEEIIHP